MADSPTRGAARPIRLGNYDIVAHIASGGMGAVYRAVDRVHRRDAAIKVLSPELASKPLMLERFRREAQSVEALDHPHIVRLYEFGEYKGTWFLAMEFVEGVDLHDYIATHGPLDDAQARAFLAQAVSALEHAFVQGIVHRDIKPSNFLAVQGFAELTVKLTDFGLARQTSDEEFRVTRDGVTVGTIDYMSPEQARDSGAADIRSDIYSLGCTLFHVLSGR